MDALWIILGAAVGGVGRRISGDAIFEQITGRGATTARLACLAIPFALLSLAKVEWWWAPVVGLLVFAGATLPQRGASLASAKDAFYLAARAVGLGAIAAPLVWWLGGLWWLPPLIGLASPSAYWVGYRVWPKQATGIGEIATGALFGAALMGSLP